MTVENNIKVMRILKLISDTVVQNDLGSLDTIEYIRCSRVLAGSNGGEKTDSVSQPYLIGT